MINRLLNLIYPEDIYCICCGSIIDGSRNYSLCNSCMEAIHWNTGRRCSICGKPLQDTYKGEICYSCMEREYSFDRVYSCAGYGLNERAVIMDFKYGDKPYIGRKLAEIMADMMEHEDFIPDIVTCIPVHRERMNQRGYNQAKILAKEFAKIRELRYTDCMERVKVTLPMKNLDAEDRFTNLEGAFSVTADVAGKSILVIDDIFTTGASLDAAAQCLKAAGAEVVCGLCFASGFNRKPGEYMET